MVDRLTFWCCLDWRKIRQWMIDRQSELWQNDKQKETLMEWKLKKINKIYTMEINRNKIRAIDVWNRFKGDIKIEDGRNRWLKAARWNVRLDTMEERNGNLSGKCRDVRRSRESFEWAKGEVLRENTKENWWVNRLAFSDWVNRLLKCSFYHDNHCLGLIGCVPFLQKRHKCVCLSTNLLPTST